MSLNIFLEKWLGKFSTRVSSLDIALLLLFSSWLGHNNNYFEMNTNNPSDEAAEELTKILLLMLGCAVQVSIRL